MLAERIVVYRNQNGPFQTVEDIKSVPGIKDALFNHVKPYITVGP